MSELPRARFAPARLQPVHTPKLPTAETMAVWPQAVPTHAAFVAEERQRRLLVGIACLSVGLVLGGALVLVLG